MDLAKLNRRVTLQAPVDVDDGQGGKTRSWKKIGQAWVEASPIAGKEGIVAGTLSATQPWRVVMRFRSDVTTANRMIADWAPGRIITIQSCQDPDGRREQLLLFCEAVPG